MTSLAVEDGTGISDADSYVSVAYADTYHAHYGNAAWYLLAGEEKEQLLRRATRHMSEVYRGRWRGSRLSNSQALCWPRQNVVVDDMGIPFVVDYHTIPSDVKAACCLLALRASSAELNPDLEPQAISESIGRLSVTYAQGANQQVRFKQVDDLLKPYLCSNAGLVRG